MDASSNSTNDQDPKTYKWWRRKTFKIYMCHVMSSWGDRMWSFSVGLYLVILYPQSLLLTAIYGFSSCVCVILFGALIGRWIDMTRRLKAAVTTIVVQNTAVIIGAILLGFTIHFQDDLEKFGSGAIKHIAYAMVIIVAVVANLASVACKIALQKDWIVVLAAGEDRKLSRLNATMRTIDLSTFILAPIVVGQVITYVSKVAGAIFIACWNVVSAILEIILLRQLFEMTPQLGHKRLSISFVVMEASPGTDDISNGPTPEITETSPQTAEESISHAIAPDDVSLQVIKSNANLSPGGFENISLGTPVAPRKIPDKTKQFSEGKDNMQSLKIMKPSLLKKFRDACSGWREYFIHPVHFAGLGLASLYMTVLGFDSITTGYMYSQGVSESIISIITALGAVFGIFGSLSFPFLRRNLGKNKTGLIGFASETLCLVLCLVSVFAAGSPFNTEALIHRFNEADVNKSDASHHANLSLEELWRNKTNVFYLMAGIVLARYGLWLADLSVTQIFQEKVDENKRGIINGVQDSLNQTMNLLKFAIVILLPDPETFGYLIFLSWSFIFIGFLFFVVYTLQRFRIRKRALVHDASFVSS